MPPSGLLREARICLYTLGWERLEKHQSGVNSCCHFWVSWI